MRDILIDGLPIMDLLEVNPSTCEVAEWSRCNQSSVSRIYRHVSGCLDLGFRKAGGVYQAHRNQELLLALRQAAQLRRLSKGCQQQPAMGRRPLERSGPEPPGRRHADATLVAWRTPHTASAAAPRD